MTTFYHHCGLVCHIGASEEGEQTIISTKLADVRVKDVMQSNVGFVNPSRLSAKLQGYVQQPIS